MFSSACGCCSDSVPWSGQSLTTSFPNIRYQRETRAAVTRTFGDRAIELTADFSTPRASDPEYEKEFVRRTTALLGNRVQLARPRGSKSYHFAQIRASQSDVLLRRLDDRCRGDPVDRVTKVDRNVP